MKITFRSSATLLHASFSIASRITQPQYSSPPLVFRAKSSSETLSKSVVNGTIWRIHPGLRGQSVIAVLVEGDLDLRLAPSALGQDELVDDRPQFRPGLVDQSGHAAAGVQQDRHLHERLRLHRPNLDNGLHDGGLRRETGRPAHTDHSNCHQTSGYDRRFHLMLLCGLKWLLVRPG